MATQDARRSKTAAPKKSYRKPETLSREKLEVLAVVCDTGKTEPLACNIGPIFS